MINFRVATEVDVDQIFNLVNDPVIRANSFKSEIIDLDTHKKWFNEKLQEPFTRIYMIYHYETFAGYVRFESCENTSIITIHLCKEYRGKSFGSKIIRKSVKMIRHVFALDKIQAYIKPENISSIISFRDAGFGYIITIPWKNQRAILMERTIK